MRKAVAVTDTAEEPPVRKAVAVTEGDEEPPVPKALPVEEPAPVLRRWSNKEGKVIEATFVKADGPDHVLLKSVEGVTYRLSLETLSLASRRLAEAGGTPPMLNWTNKDGAVLAAAFESMDGPDHVLLRPETGLLYRYPVENLRPESQFQATISDGLPQLSVVFIGDSMSLGGFGKRLDQNLRACAAFGGVYTYMACGTNPLSWMKARPYTNIKTACGFWSIETEPGSSKPSQVVDTYGMRSGYKPTSRTVPKIENLLTNLKPDVLVIQLGNNLFSAFRDGKTIRPSHGEMVRTHVKPFVTLLAKHPSKLRKVYWVTPPQAGSVSEEIQEFVFQQIKTCAEPLVTVIDSRKLTKFPYKNMGGDKEHFWGKEAIEWADQVFDRVSRDLVSKRFWSLPQFNEQEYMLAAATEVGPPAPAADDTLCVKARLVSKTAFPEPAAFAPYQELMAGYHYEVIEVISGQYAEKDICVMHPAYIRLQKQDIEQMEIGTVQEMKLRKLDADSVWGSIRRVGGPLSFDRDDYILVEDENRYPQDPSIGVAQIPDQNQ